MAGQLCRGDQSPTNVVVASNRRFCAPNTNYQRLPMTRVHFFRSRHDRLRQRRRRSTPSRDVIVEFGVVFAEWRRREAVDDQIRVEVAVGVAGDDDRGIVGGGSSWRRQERVMTSIAGVA